MKVTLKSSNVANPELELSLVLKHQFNLVRSKLTGSVNISKSFKKMEDSIVLTKEEQELISNDIPKTGNELLDQYYMEGMKLFCQGPFAENVGKNEDQLGVYL